MTKVKVQHTQNFLLRSVLIMHIILCPFLRALSSDEKSRKVLRQNYEEPRKAINIFHSNEFIRWRRRKNENSTKKINWHRKQSENLDFVKILLNDFDQKQNVFNLDFRWITRNFSFPTLDDVSFFWRKQIYVFREEKLAQLLLEHIN